MLYYSINNISDVSDEDSEILRLKINKHFSQKANLKRKESVVAKAALCLLLKEKYGLTDFEVDCDENGKPFITGNCEFFNLSHSADLTLCVCGNEKVGCDIQEIKPYNSKVAKRFFTEKEYNILEKSDDSALAFTRIWTLKESVLKFSGEGITGGLDRYDFSTYYKHDAFEYEGLKFMTLELSGYVASFCSKTGNFSQLSVNLNNIIKNDF